MIYFASKYNQKDKKTMTTQCQQNTNTFSIEGFEEILTGGPAGPGKPGRPYKPNITKCQQSYLDFHFCNGFVWDQ